MRLWHTKTVWEKLAREDPYWAVLTDPDKSGNRWSKAEFFSTGQQTVDTDMQSVARIRPMFSKNRALDFGCGVGRLTQALAAHFDHVDGVDVAQPMIDLACQHNRQPERVKFHVNVASDLSLFPNSHFDFVYSVISLQHIPPPLIRRYLAEFCRICRPDGLIFFQLPATSPQNKFRFSWYPPTLWMRAKRWMLLKTAFLPEMTMNALPKGEVLSIFEQNGAKSINIAPYDAADELESWSYLFEKGSCR